MLKRAALAVLMIVTALPAWAQSQPSVPFAPQPPIVGVGPGFDPSNPAANINNLIAAINRVITPLVPLTPGAVNFIALQGGVSGNGAVIGIQPGGNANVAIKIQPAGNGNIVLFDSIVNQNSIGLIKVGNIASWVPTTGLEGCPAVNPGKAPLGMADHVTGYLMIKDWLDRQHGIPGC